MTMRCKTCGYDLARLAEHRCPECGKAFNPSDATTFRGAPKPGSKLNHVKFVLLAIICAPVVNWLILAVPALMQKHSGGWFDDPLSKLVMAAIVAMLLWPFWLVTALILFLVFEVVNIMRTKKG